ncbi:MAG: radical SAM protein [Candidatus Omnitrophota bacterium]
MNIALIRPPKISGAFEKILIQEPINLAYIAAYLKNHKFNVNLWDFEVEKLSKAILEEKLIKNKIDIVGITAMTPSINNAHNIASIIKNVNSRIPILIGGPHISAIPEQTLKEFLNFDLAVTGEGEIPLLEFSRKFSQNFKFPKHIPGIISRNPDDNSPQKNTFIENLDQLPFPERAFFKEKLYKNLYIPGINMYKKKPGVVFSSRGCNDNCTFCAIKNTQGSKIRFRSARNVLAEITECKEKFGYNHITFEDTNFTLDKTRLANICQGLEKLKITWSCQTKVNLVNRDIIYMMKKSGCIKIAYGVESGSERILKLMKKNITVKQIKDAFSLTHKAKITSCAFFILGSHPDETKEDIQKTEQLLHAIKPDIFQMGIICPYPGTEIYNVMKQENLISNIDWSKFNFMHTIPAWSTRHINAHLLIKLQKKIYLKYIFSFNFLFSFLKKLLNPLEFLHCFKLSLAMINYLLFENRK